MYFKNDIVPWIDELKNYILDDTKKSGEIKKILRAADFSKLSYPDQSKLSKMFDPECDISIELFKRQLDLYFELLEGKDGAVRVPIFSDYVEWVCSQDIKIMNDPIFSAIALRLIKSTATSFPEEINGFMMRLPNEFNCKIDSLSNDRLNTFVAVLKAIKTPYKDMPKECQAFVRNMFKACAVKTEIADNNKKRMRGIFADDPQGYFSMFNKAFLNVGFYEDGLDEPAKKITYKNMVKYANYQNEFLNNTPRNFVFSEFQKLARNYCLYNANEPSNYLPARREYKDYAKKMKDLFVEMINTEILGVAQDMCFGVSSLDDIGSEFAVTNKMKEQFKKVESGDDFVAVRMAAYYLIDLIHLDELTGKNKSEIFDADTVGDAYKKAKLEAIESAKGEDIFYRICNHQCNPSDLQELYEFYEKDPSNYEVQSAILDLENMNRENELDDD